MLSALMIAFTSCNDDVTPLPNYTGQINLMFDAYAGSSDLDMSKEFTNSTGETFTLTKFQYYVSNIKLKKADGSAYAVPTTSNSGYYLVKEDRTLQLTGVPAGDYTGVEFMLGVDSTRNTMGTADRAGDLDIGNLETGGDMYWSWNSGYIFMKFEGEAAAVPDSTQGQWVQDSTNQWVFDTTLYTVWNDIFNIHVGGFGGYDIATPNNTRMVELDMPSVNIDAEDKKYMIHVTADVLKIMDGDVDHSFSEFYQEHSPAKTGNIANNAQNMFTVHHVMEL